MAQGAEIIGGDVVAKEVVVVEVLDISALPIGCLQDEHLQGACRVERRRFGGRSTQLIGHLDLGGEVLKIGLHLDR
jgi:hypothetical protein